MALKTMALALPVAALVVSVMVPTHPAVTIVCAAAVIGCLAAMAIGRAYRARLTR